MGDDAHDAVSADGENGQGVLVVPAPDREPGRRSPDDAPDLLQVAAGLFHPDDVGDLRQPDGGLCSEVGDGARRDVVENARDGDRLGDGPEVTVEALLRRLVVVGHDQEQPVGARPLRLAREFDALGGAVGARACDDVAPARQRLFYLADQAQLLLARQGRGFARRPADHQRVASGLDERDGQSAGADVVHGAVPGERRDHRGNHPPERRR